MQGCSPEDQQIEIAEDTLAFASRLISLGEELKLYATGNRQRAARAKAIRRRKPALRLIAAAN